MSRSLQRLCAWWRQRTYPAAFRIRMPADGDCLESLVCIHQAAHTPPPPPPAPAPEPVALAPERPPAEAPPPLSRDFLIALCNQQFRLRRSAAKLAPPGQEPRPVQRLQDIMNDIDDLLKGHGAEWKDLTGEPMDDGRTDFEALGRPDVIPDLDRMRIVLCETPRILIAGKLAQRAKGIVGIPPRPSAAPTTPSEPNPAP